MKKNGNTRWNEGFHGSEYGYKVWGNMGCFGNPIVYCSTFVIFSIIYGKDSLSSLDVDMVDHTMLQPRASLCKLFFIFLFLNYYYLHQSFRWHNK